MNVLAANRYALLYAYIDENSDNLNAVLNKQPKQKNNETRNKINKKCSAIDNNQAVSSSSVLTVNKKSVQYLSVNKNTEKENDISAVNKKYEGNPEKNAFLQGQNVNGEIELNENSSLHKKKNKGLTDHRQPYQGNTTKPNASSHALPEKNEEQHKQQRYQSEKLHQNRNIEPADYQSNNDCLLSTRKIENNCRRENPEFGKQFGSNKFLDKKEGVGNYNLRSEKQGIEDLNKTTQEVGLTKHESAGEEQPELPKITEEVKQMTFDEWKAQLAIRTRPQYNFRKPGEGEDISQWKEMIALKNKKYDKNHKEEVEYDPSMYPQRIGRLKRVSNIQFQFTNCRELEFNRRARLRAVGGAANINSCDSERVTKYDDDTKSFENDNEERPQTIGDQHAPKVDDNNDFPLLV